MGETAWSSPNSSSATVKSAMDSPLNCACTAPWLAVWCRTGGRSRRAFRLPVDHPQCRLCARDRR
jgi:hypothetical protein